MNKLTKQGVRNLDLIIAPKVKRLEMPPIPINCKHRNKSYDSFMQFVTCKDCGEELE